MALLPDAKGSYLKKVVIPSNCGLNNPQLEEVMIDFRFIIFVLNKKGMKMLKKVENFKPVIISSILAGLSVQSIKRLLLEKYSTRVKTHELSKFISDNRQGWAKALLFNNEHQSHLCEAIKLKKIKRKRRSNHSIPANCVADVLSIACNASNYKESLPKVNQFLCKKNVGPISYDQLCRSIRKMKGGN